MVKSYLHHHKKIHSTPSRIDVDVLERIRNFGHGTCAHAHQSAKYQNAARIREGRAPSHRALVVVVT